MDNVLFFAVIIVGAALYAAVLYRIIEWITRPPQRPFHWRR